MEWESKGRRNATFWEELIENKALVVWNTEDATRLGGNSHSIIDLTLSSPNVELNWSIAGDMDATGSDHEVIVWEILGQGLAVGGVSKDTTGWDISGWMTAGKSGEAREVAERKRAEAREVYLRAANRTLLLNEESTVEEVDTAAAGLKEAMTGTLDELAKKKRWCSRSKRWWSEDLKQLRQELGTARREWKNRPAGTVALRKQGATSEEASGGPSGSAGTGSYKKAKGTMSGQRPDTRPPKSTRLDRSWSMRKATSRKETTTER